MWLRAASAFLLGAVAAQQTPISTDRPSETVGTGIVPGGTVQLEMGYKLTRAEENDSVRVATHTLPDLLVRVPLVDELEARLTVNGWSFRDQATERQDGFNDVSIGAKWALLEESANAPALSILPEVSLPVGDPGFTEHFVNPKLLILLRKGSSNSTSITTNIGTSIIRLSASDARDERTVVDVPYTALLSGSASEHLGWFVELFGAFAMSGRPDRHSLQGGATLLVAGTFQLDARAGVGLVVSAPTWSLGVGLALRVPR